MFFSSYSKEAEGMRIPRPAEPYLFKYINTYTTTKCKCLCILSKLSLLSSDHIRKRKKKKKGKKSKTKSQTLLPMCSLCGHIYEFCFPPHWELFSTHSEICCLYITVNLLIFFIYMRSVPSFLSYIKLTATLQSIRLTEKSNWTFLIHWWMKILSELSDLFKKPVVHLII